MGGVFMKKLTVLLCTCLLVVSAFWFADILKDRQTLNNNLLRLHVVADSDEPEKQTQKLLVKDAVVSYLQERMENVEDLSQAVAFLEGELPALEQLARRTLDAAGVTDRVTVSLEKEAFPVRKYDTFSLPSGVYQSLRIVIGEGKGHNWWCVVFPRLCLPATSQGFEDNAAGAGFSDPLVNTLEEKPGYEVRFFFLDCLGWLENLFFK
jgi:stage II sporulation protein R